MRPGAQRRPAGETRAAEVVQCNTHRVRPTTAEKLLRHALGTGDVGLARLLSYLITGEMSS